MFYLVYYFKQQIETKRRSVADIGYILKIKDTTSLIKRLSVIPQSNSSQQVWMARETEAECFTPFKFTNIPIGNSFDTEENSIWGDNGHSLTQQRYSNVAEANI